MATAHFVTTNAQTYMCTDDERYRAYKTLITNIAESLGPKYVEWLAFHLDLHQDVEEKIQALDLLKLLEKKGLIGPLKMDTLKDMLSNIQRHDLNSKLVEPFERKFIKTAGASTKELLNNSGTFPLRSRIGDEPTTAGFQENQIIPQQQSHSQEFTASGGGEKTNHSTQEYGLARSNFRYGNSINTSFPATTWIPPQRHSLNTANVNASSHSLSDETRERHQSEQMQTYHVQSQSSVSQLSLPESNYSSTSNRVQSLHSQPRNPTTYNFLDESHTSLESSNTSASSILLPSSHHGIGYDLRFVSSEASDLSSAPSELKYDSHRRKMFEEESEPYFGQTSLSGTFDDELLCGASQFEVSKSDRPTTDLSISLSDNDAFGVTTVTYPEDVRGTSPHRLPHQFQTEQSLKHTMLPAEQSVEHASELRKCTGNLNHPSDTVHQTEQPTRQNMVIQERRVEASVSTHSITNLSNRGSREALTSKWSPCLATSLHSKVAPSSSQPSCIEERANGHSPRTVLKPTTPVVNKTKFGRPLPAGGSQILKLARRSRSKASKHIHEWSIKRNKLNKVIYEHKESKFFQCPDKLELDVQSDSGSNLKLKLTLALYPYGLEQDRNQNVTLRVDIDVPRKSPKLNDNAKVKLTVAVQVSLIAGEYFSKEFCKEISTFTREYYIYGIIPHETLKESKSDSLKITAYAEFLPHLNI